MAKQQTRSLHRIGTSRAVLELLQSIFVAELLSPGMRLWIVSPWVSDIAVVDNSARSFSTLCPEWQAAPIRLSAVLTALMERGTQIVLIVNQTSHNDDILARMEQLSSSMPGKLICHREADLHEKGLLGDHFTLNGSMNLTYNGVHVNDEYLIYDCVPAAVEQRRLELENRWRALV